MRAAYPLLCLVLPVLVTGNIIGHRREKNVRRQIYQPDDGLDQFLQMKMQWINNQIQDRIQQRRHHQTIPQRQNYRPEEFYRPNRDEDQYGKHSSVEHNSEEKNSKERNSVGYDAMAHQSMKRNSKEHNSMEHNSMEYKSKEHKSSELHNSMEPNSKEYNSKERYSNENSKEHNTKQRNSNEHNSKEYNSNEKSYKEHNSKEHNSNEHDSKEKNVSYRSESQESISNLTPKVQYSISKNRLLREKKPQSVSISWPQTQVNNLNRIDSSESQESVKSRHVQDIWRNEEVRKPEHVEVEGKYYNVLDSQENRNEPSVSWKGNDRFGENRRTGRNWPLFTALSSLMYPGSINDVISWYDAHSSETQSPIVQYMTDLEDSVKAAYDHFKPKDAVEKDRFHVLYESAVHLNDSNMYRNATELLQANNYPVEEHNVKTDDGYILTIFHIPPKTESYEADRKVVFLMHGLLESADSWLLQGPGNSLAYLLADAGYDVWLGNVRGSKYGRRHVSKQPEEQDFWQFTNDEIALHDLPAMIDYVLDNTQQAKLYYVGHAQGTTTFFALTASQPEYNSKIEGMHALSPMVYMTYTRNPVFRMLSPDSQTFNSIYDTLGRGEFKPSSEVIEAIGGNWCRHIIGCKDICANLNFVMSGVNEQRLNASQTPVFTRHLPAGGSVRVIKHYAQWISSHEFRKYNYGSSNNKQLYGSAHPPKYDLSQVTVPVSLYYSDDDWQAQPGDVQKLKSELPSVKHVYKVLRPFTHLDYQFSKDARKLVYDKLIAFLKN